MFLLLLKLFQATDVVESTSCICKWKAEFQVLVVARRPSLKATQVSQRHMSAKKKLLVASLFLVVRPGAPSSVLAPSSDARSP